MIVIMKYQTELKGTDCFFEIRCTHLQVSEQSDVIFPLHV